MRNSPLLELVSFVIAMIISCFLAGLKMFVPIPSLEWEWVLSPLIVWACFVSVEVAIIFLLMS